MNHALNVSTVLLEDFTDDRGIGTGWRKHQLSYSKRASLDPIGQTITSGINQIWRNAIIESFRIFLGHLFRKDIVTCRGQSIAACTAVIFAFVCSLSRRTESYDAASCLDMGIINHIFPLHPGGYRTIDNNRTNQISHIRSFTSCRIDTDSQIAHIL